MNNIPEIHARAHQSRRNRQDHRKRYTRKARDTGTQDQIKRLGEARKSFHAVMATSRVPSSTHQVANWIAANVLGYSRLGDYYSTAHIAAQCELDRSTVWRALRQLVEIEAIVWVTYDHGRNWIGVVGPDAVAPEPQSRREGRDKSADGVAHVATHKALVGTCLGGEGGQTITTAQPDPPAQAPPTTTPVTSTADTVRALTRAKTPDPDEYTQMAKRIEDANATRYLAVMLSEGERHEWPREVAKAAIARAHRDRHNRSNQPQCQTCNGTTWVLPNDLSATEAKRCPTCQPTNSLSLQIPTGPPQPLGLPQHDKQPTLPGNAAGIEQARKALAPDDRHLTLTGGR